MSATRTKQAAANRVLARRARRLATLSDADDSAGRLLRYAEELEAQAVDLERAKEGG